MIDHINEIFAPDTQLKTRSKKMPQKMKEIIEEEANHNIKLSRLSLLEEDDYEKDDKDDSDYEMDENDEGKEKKKRAARPKMKFGKDIRFGRINVWKYFNYEKENVNNDYPNYNNIIAKPLHKRPLFKICNLCFGIATYTCKHCNDKYCSIDCFKIHKDTKCSKYYND